MRCSVFVCLLVAAATLTVAAAKRGASFGRSKGGSKSRTPSPPRRTQPPPQLKPSSSDTFLNAERGGSATHNRGNQFTPSAPQPQHTNNQPHNTNNQPHNTNNQPHNTNGPIGFEGINNNGNNKPNRPIGFDNVNSQTQNRPVGNSPPYPVGPPPSYPGASGGTHGGTPYEHPPPYPGRPVNAPPTYQQGTSSNYPGQHNTYPGQQNPYPGQHNPYPGQHNPYPGQHNPYPGYQNPYPGQYNPYPGQQNFGQHGYSGYPGNYPGASYSYSGTSFGGSPFGGGYNGNPHYSPQNFGYSGYPGQYQQPSRSRFGGLPIPIPIPIPIPLGGGGLFGDRTSYNRHVLDTFIQTDKANETGNSTSVFLLNNSTVAPCTTDHFFYNAMMTFTVTACTADSCTAIKLTARTNTTKETVHSVTMTMCLDKNATVTSHGTKVHPKVSPIANESTSICRDVPKNVTIIANSTETTTASTATTEPATTEATTTGATTVTSETTTVETTVTPKNESNTTRLCETVHCWTVEMCMPTIEVVDKCEGVCPFRRTGYGSCVTLKMCRSPTVPASTTAAINNTISKIDEYNRFNGEHYVANLTLIAYRPPVVSFNCSQNPSAPGCPTPPTSTPTPTTSPPVNTDSQFSQAGGPVHD